MTKALRISIFSTKYIFERLFRNNILKVEQKTDINCNISLISEY